MMHTEQEKQAWRDVKYSQRFLNAFRGVYVVFKTTRHIFIHVSSAVVVILLGFYFNVSPIEWIALVFAIGLVFVTEAFNTAIEIDIDLTSPDYHPYARDTKDVAAAAVLLASLSAFIVGLIVFLPKFIRIF